MQDFLIQTFGVFKVCVVFLVRVFVSSSFIHLFSLRRFSHLENHLGSLYSTCSTEEYCFLYSETLETEKVVFDS